VSIQGEWTSTPPPPPAAPATGLLADRPASPTDGSLYHASDQQAVYVAVGGAWVRITAAAGSISATLAATATAGFILLQGQAWPSTVGIYADLFAKFGGSNLPDFQGFVPAGKGAAPFNGALGATLGAATVALVTAELPVHSHGLTGSPTLTGAPALSGTPSLSGSPSLSGAPSISGAPTLSGSPALSGTPSLSGSPGVSDPTHSHTSGGGPFVLSGGTYGNTGGSGSSNASSNPTVSSASTGISVNAGTLAVSAGSLAVSAGSLAVSAGSLAVGGGSLAVGIGSLAIAIGSLTTGKGTLAIDFSAVAVASTGSGTAHQNCQPSQLVNWEAKL
jgi:microcystin-dependent protein